MIGLCYLCINLYVIIWIVFGDKIFSVDEFIYVDISLWDVGFIFYCWCGWCMIFKIGCVIISINRFIFIFIES